MDFFKNILRCFKKLIALAIIFNCGTLYWYVPYFSPRVQIAHVPRSLRTANDYRGCIEQLADLVCTKICLRSAPSARSRIPVSELMSRTSLSSQLSCCKNDDRCHQEDEQLMSPVVAENYEFLKKVRSHVAIFKQMVLIKISFFNCRPSTTAT